MKERSLFIIYVIASLSIIMFLGFNYKQNEIGEIATQEVEIVVDTPTPRCIISTYKPTEFESAVKRTE